MTEAQKFFVGEVVEKVSGKTKFWGVIKSAYEINPGEWRYDVMAIHPDFYGCVHIFSTKDLRHKTAIIHRKRGSLYSILGDARIQSDNFLEDMDAVVVYVEADGRLWARAKEEMTPDRFENLP